MADTDGRDRASATKFVAPFTYLIPVVNQSVQFYCAIYRVSHLEKDLCTWFLAKFDDIFAVFSENVCTPVQITFLTKPTGIYLLITYNRHIPSHTSKKIPVIIKNYPLFASRSAGLRECFIVEVTNIVCRVSCWWPENCRSDCKRCVVDRASGFTNIVCKMVTVILTIKNKTFHSWERGLCRVDCRQIAYLASGFWLSIQKGACTYQASGSPISYVRWGDTKVDLGKWPVGRPAKFPHQTPITII